MEFRLLRILAAAAALAASLPAPAQGAGETGTAAAASCRAPQHEGHPMGDREARIAEYGELGEQCLKRLLVECNAAASRQLLDTGSAFGCSLGYEALLRRHFRGDFQAMLAWWRSPERTGVN